jgi:DNA-binding LytR/AlgR family response regulator
MPPSLFAKVNGRLYRIAVDEIMFAEADKHYIRIHTAKFCFYTHFTLGQLENILPPESFCRIHRSYLIAIHKIDSFDHEYVYIKDKQLDISAQYYEILKSKVVILNDFKTIKVISIENTPANLSFVHKQG